ncbi:MAG: GAF domain-containing protein [Chloroflexota bacterium]|nr:GAF domain-containing protein [Anaerolineales bacterium]
MTLNETSTTPKNPTHNELARLWYFLFNAHPSVTEVGEKRRAQLIATISLILAVGFVLGLISGGTVGAFIALLAISIVSYALSRTRYYNTGAYVIAYGFMSLAYLMLYFKMAGGFESDITTIAYAAVIVASILLPTRGFFVLVVLSVIATWTAPLYTRMVTYDTDGFFRIAGTFMTLSFVLVGANIFRNWIERARLKEVKDVNRQLEDLAANLEQRVNERTFEIEEVNKHVSKRATQLRTITELAESISQVQDLNELLPAATRLISERFGFYHVGIFLVDHDHQYAVLQAANSEGGERMLKRSHRLQLGTGVVGYSAKTGQPRIALDVGVDAVFFNNPDLPETRSETALPLKSRGETIGVLDIQSRESNAFSREDLEVLTTLANQVSIALEKARLLTETRAALAQVQEVYNAFTHAEWSRTLSQTTQSGFRYQAGRIEMLEDVLQNSEVLSAVQSGEVAAAPVDESVENHATVAVPVKLRGEVIGILHIESSDPSREWQSDEISLMQAVAERAAFAMENARLFQDARRRAAKERLISEATARISSAFNVENILQTTAEELERVLGGSEISIQFQSKES